MKLLLAIAIASTGLLLSSCNGTCPFAGKKTCPAGCTKPCCTKKTSDCKTCSQ